MLLFAYIFYCLEVTLTLTAIISKGAETSPANCGIFGNVRKLKPSGASYETSKPRTSGKFIAH